MKLARPDFSLCHPSARPEVWPKTRDKWLEAASGTLSIEHVVALDYGTCVPNRSEYGISRIVWNYWAKCSVDATNVAALGAVGHVLVVISDDIYPCHEWDWALRKIPELWGDKPCVVRVSTGGSADHSGLLTIQILNRVRYEQIGYLFHPSYVSMYSDAEFTEHAEADGVVVNAPHIMFRHEHPTTPGSAAEVDEVYQRQNAPERYEYGEALLAFRRERGFPAVMSQELQEMRLAIQ
jgi:hypothetical protein